MELLEFSLESFRDESYKLARLVEASGYRPDCVAYLAKGAWQIGEVCAGYFGVPMFELTAHRSGESVKGNTRSVLQVLPKCIRKQLRTFELNRRFASADGSNQLKTMRLTDKFEVPVNAQSILIVDDAADTGSSLVVARELVAELLPEATIKTAVISSFDPARSIGSVDFSLHENVLLCSPMSKDNKDYLAALSSYETMGKNTEAYVAAKET